MELSKVTGIGTKNISLLNSVGIYDVTDLLSYYPYRYQIYKINNINDVKSNESVINYFNSKVNERNKKVLN